jgi:lipopolysaccharide export system protein LptA
VKFHLGLLALFYVHIAFAAPLSITSTKMHTDDTAKQAHFIGDVVLKQGQDWLTSDTLIVYVDENKTAQKYEAIHNVKFEVKKGETIYQGKANKVIYNPLEDIYTLLGNAHVKDTLLNRDTIGEKIVVDLTNESLKVEGDKLKPVKMTFEVGKK